MTPRSTRDAAGAPTINDVARRAGVSKGLVSLVVNDRPGVAPLTRERILRAVDELEWRPSVQARTLSTQTTYALGLVLRRAPAILTADPFYPGFMAGIESVLAPQGRVLVLSVIGDDEGEERAYRNLATDRRVDGVFLTDLRVDDHRVELLTGIGVPAVLIGHLDRPAPFPSVTLDDAPGVAAAVDHLADLGHRRIGYVAGDPSLLHAQRRRAAFERAITRRGLIPSTVTTDFSMASGAIATAALIDRPDPPTAIVYANDPMAVAGLGVLASRGIAVPGDVSIVGFDGAELGKYTYPTLTTVRSDAEAWGAAAARTLLLRAESGKADDLDLPVAELVLGQSTSSPPAHTTT